MDSYKASQLLEAIEAQNETIKKLRDDKIKTLIEANAIMLKYQAAIDLGATAINLLEAKLAQANERIKQLECEALGRSWDATK